jgi:asparagine synthase (glutamine-hydrolysing)
MSGLAGIRPAAGAEGTPLAPVAAALAHRGPAGQLDLDLTAGARLSVRHRDGERVTARSSDGVVVVLDGELYATAVLAEELAAAGHPVPADADDPSLALAAYAAFGLGGLGWLDGAFALVIHDGRDGATHLAVDRAGAGALYRVTTADGSTLYASEPTALLAAEGVPAAPDDAVLRQFLRSGVSDTGEATFFAGISRVTAGQVVTLTDAEAGTGAGVRSTAYPVPDPTAPTAAASTLDAAVAIRANGGRVLTRLSHGLAGTVLAAKAGAGEVVVGNYPPYGDGESGATAKALAALGTGARTVDVDPGDHLAEFVRAVGEPVGDLASYALYAITASIADDADALLAADGADAVLAAGAPGPKKAGSKRPVEVDALLISENGTVADPRARQAAGVATALRVADRAGARAGVRVRLPYADAVAARSLGEAALTRPGGGEAVLKTVAGNLGTGSLAPGAPVRDWLLRMKNRVYGEFLSESFTNRPWVRQHAVLVAFEDFIKGRNADAALFWRLLSVELWMREFFDPEPEAAEPVRTKGLLEANARKQLEITVDGERWIRFPVRTELFATGDPYSERITSYVRGLVDAVWADGAYRQNFTKPWYVLVSEKIVAISQGRSYFIWDIQPSWWARTLSKFVVRTPYGIGLGSPWTMQLAIQEAGLARILAASAAGAAGKVLGKRGVFYNVAGHSVRAIDGPTEYSAYPSNVSAKLAPARPDEVSAELLAALRAALPAEAAATLAGVVVIDANDIGRNVLGHAADRPARFFEELFADNPLGQGSEQTPIAVAVPAE